MEAMLRRQMPGGAGPGDACPDAETLAAWTDGGLDARAQAQVEAHAAGCARCQALMAAIVKSEPAPAALAPEGSWSRWSLRWLVPLTAAAAATLVWVLVPGGEQPSTRVKEELTQARAESPTQPAAVETPAAEPSAIDLQKALPGAAPKDERDAAASRSPGDVARDSALEAAPAELPPARAETEAKTVRPVPADAPAPLAETDSIERERRSAEAAAERPSPAAPAPPPAAQAQAAPAAGAPAGTREGFAGNTLSQGIVSSDPAVRWRLAGPGVVERSTDAGSSWTRLETGVAATFTAGSAPSGSVCWLVGPGGVVLVTTDARTWRRVTSPAALDLAAVDATDATSATVRTANGRAFRTTDGGGTWVAVP
ncbi:MAG: zf-HC2 domain-containing protein [Vicinamibacterales bacterium]